MNVSEFFDMGDEYNAGVGDKWEVARAWQVDTAAVVSASRIASAFPASRRAAIVDGRPAGSTFYVRAELFARRSGDVDQAPDVLDAYLRAVTEPRASELIDWAEENYLPPTVDQTDAPSGEYTLTCLVPGCGSKGPAIAVDSG